MPVRMKVLPAVLRKSRFNVDGTHSRIHDRFAAVIAVIRPDGTLELTGMSDVESTTLVKGNGETAQVQAVENHL